MKSKQEVIQEAWGELYALNKSNINEDGFHYGLWVNSVNGKVPLKDYITDGDGMYAPKSLSGIETNNGWIRIDSETDLPKKQGNYWACINGEIQSVWFEPCELYNDMWRNVTHYQPIIKPEFPIY